MFAGRSSSTETITLSWKMPDAAWIHWAHGRGEKSVRDVILDEIDKLHKSPEAVKAAKERCEAIDKDQDAPREDEAGQLQHEIKVQLPAADWGEASLLVGRVSTRQLLAALILESESWRQDGDADSEFGAGWYQNDLDSSLRR